MFPGYKGVHWGEFTEGKPYSNTFDFRTQVHFNDGTAYWLDVVEGSVLVGDQIEIVERPTMLQVKTVGTTLRREYFEGENPVKARFGTLVDLYRLSKSK